MEADSGVIREILKKTRTIAIVGAKDSPGQPVDRVGRYLIAAGYEIFPVHPARRDIWGLPVCKTIADLPRQVDIINLFRAAEYCPDHAREVLTLPHKPLMFWMQLGIVSSQAAGIMEKAGIAVVQNACLMVEHRRLLNSASEDIP